MSKTQILQELPKLNADERQEIRVKLNELDGISGDTWIGDELTEDEKGILDTRLAEYEKNPNAGDSWEEVEARIRGQLKQ